MTTRAYLRVSTDQQDAASQRAIIEEWAATNDANIATWTTDTASGATPWQLRSLPAMLDAASPGDVIVVSEISRIARSVVGVLSFLQEAAGRGVGVVAIRSAIRLDDSLSAKVVVTVLALAAEIERDLIRERTRAALAAKRARGEALGRRVGQIVASKLDARREEIAKCLAARVGKRAIARMVGCSPATLYAWLAKNSTPNDDDKTLDIFEDARP